MNYDQPRQLKEGGWHYTSMNDGRVWPIGYCRDHDGHATEDEARRCYRDYELNECLRLDGGTWANHWQKCDYPGCENLTNKPVMIGGWHRWTLCDEHRTKECCTELYGETAGNSVHS
jgi:hypothetical protein